MAADAYSVDQTFLGRYKLTNIINAKHSIICLYVGRAFTTKLLN